MELRQLRYFVTLAEERHFGRAAERLHIVSSALSKQMIALERELGAELIDRSQGVRLTSAGQVFCDRARVILQQTERAIGATQATARGEIGSLDIGFTPPAMWSVLPPILREHRSRFPDLSFHLNELGSPQQTDRLRDGTLDVGFVRALVQDDVLHLEPIWRESIIIAIADTHPLADQREIELADLRDEAFYSQARSLGPAGLPELFASMCIEAGFTPRLIEEANSPASLTMVAMGLGVTLLPESAQDTDFKGVAFRPLTRPTPELDLVVACRRDNHSAALQTFLETVRDVVPEVQAHGRPAPRDALVGRRGELPTHRT